MKILLAVLLAAAMPGMARAENKPAFKWVPNNEFYFILPLPQNIYLPGNKETAQVRPWGLGLMSLGNGEEFSKTGGLQLQHVNLNGSSLGADNSFYIFDFLAGLGYMSPKIQTKPLRFTASALGDIGLAAGDFFMAPVVSAGLFYQTDNGSDAPSGINFTFFYRFTEISLSDMGGGTSGKLRPALGFKIGYIFKGFWTQKEPKG
ncbi:MAG: hypothetical protein NTX59_06260 [Elusimicrobia bacterium]|nr:hypothetical protein [Elusimicrobiota bacterium]